MTSGIEKIKIKKGSQEAWIMPESLEVWEDHGWKEAKLNKDEKEANPIPSTLVNLDTGEKADSEKK